MAMSRWIRITVLVVLAAVAVVVLFEWVFPWVESTYYNPSVG